MNPSDEPKYTCPACGFIVFIKPLGSFDTCPVCSWQDDDFQFENPNLQGGSNRESLIEHQKKWLISLPVDIIEKQIDSTQKTYMRDPEWIPYIFYTKIEDITEKESKILRLVSINENEIEQFFSKSHVYDRYIEIHISYVILALKDLNLEALKRAIFLQWYAQAKPYYISGIKTLNHNYEIKAMDKMIEDYQKDVLDEEFKIMLIHYYKFMDDIFSNYKNFDKISDLFSSENLKKCTYDPLKKYSYKNRGRMGMYWLNILEPDTD